MPRDDPLLSAPVLEIAGGSGEHAVWFSGALPVLIKALMAAARRDAPGPNESERTVRGFQTQQATIGRTRRSGDQSSQAAALNAAIAAFNQAIEPICLPVVEALDGYNAILEKARALSIDVTEAAHGEFDARSERWQQSDKGIFVRIWIEKWELSLDDIDLDMPEPLTEIDPDDRALEIEGAPPNPTE